MTRTFKSFTQLSYHSKLNPDLWKNNILKDPIRNALLKIAYEWVIYAKIPHEAIVDYTLVGGNCAFNYNKNLSDIDVHILINPHKMPIKDRDIQHDYIMAKKNTWTSSHSITVAGYPVELYAQSTDEVIPKGQGCYSLTKNSWIIEPTHMNIRYNYSTLKNNVKEYIEAITKAVSTDNLNDAKNIKDRIVQGRKEGLSATGEFNVQNELFKTLRNTGYLAKLTNFINQKEDEKLSFNRRR